ncbi:MAG: ABC transporter ATP-binding protein [Elusimicrobiota bacterium]|nr:ABC transporter ATP-binding protein [Elusimicrobiota bacterium]
MAIPSNLPSPLRRLLHYTASHRRTVWEASAYSILNKVMDIAPEILIGVAVDVVSGNRVAMLVKMGFETAFSGLVALAGLTLLIWVLESTFEYLYEVRWRGLAQTVQHELRLDAYGHVQRLDMAFFEDRSTGALTATLNDDINQLERFLNGGANMLIQVFATVVLVGAVFFYLAPKVAMLAMAPIPFILAGAFYYQFRVEPLYAGVREQAAQIAARLSNNISGIATIKAYTAEQRELDAIGRESRAYTEANAKAIRVSSAFIPIIRMAILAGFLATLVVGGKMTLDGQLTVGSFSVLVFLTQRLLWPLTGLAETVDLYQRAMASTARVLDLLETPIALAHHGKALPRAGVKGELRFEKVSFAYPGRKPSLTEVDLVIPAGTTAAFVGATGAGKTTLTKLLLRFYDPTSGRILLDGQDIRQFEPAELRRAVGFVAQDTFLFHGTAGENIAYGDPGKDGGALVEAAKAAEAHEFIAALPSGYDTVVGERGQKLSGGQRQRLAIARAVLKDPPIMVFDEATSAVDNETEAAIQKSLERVAVGRTTILVAHRLSTIVKADRIFVLEDGRVVESGTHGELLAKGGAYAALWRVQTGLAA